MANTKRSPTPVSPCLLCGERRHGKDVAWQGKTVQTGTWKTRELRPLMARRAQHRRRRRATWPVTAASNAGCVSTGRVDRILVPRLGRGPGEDFGFGSFGENDTRGGTTQQRGVRRRAICASARQSSR